ncbi:hypothetical protein ACU610_06040 [Geodermatophilus sp. URMC 61]|uniref:hypothetical protein n=1 Tax=Geodermatophilus sp. URMC 61 TaxID=3423411 RepID=UPI00406CBE5F
MTTSAGLQRLPARRMEAAPDPGLPLPTRWDPYCAGGMLLRRRRSPTRHSEHHRRRPPPPGAS